jgi:purine-nucleoside phosphorylase
MRVNRYEELQLAAAAIAAATGKDQHQAGVVLGSGLSDYAATIPGAIEVPYSDIPGFPLPGVQGHAGSLFSIDVDGAPVLLFAGRVHTYESGVMDEVVFGVRTAAMAGCHSILLTNAAGGIGTGLQPGDLVAIRDHINLAGYNPLVGANDSRLGPRFPDLTHAWSLEAREMIQQTSIELGMPYKEGVYAWFLGPTYETPAEIEMVRRIGGDLVGMSTVPEAIALRHMGVRVAGISLVTNLAAGISPHPLSHDEVTETAAMAKVRFTQLINALLPRLVVPPA